MIIRAAQSIAGILALFGAVLLDLAPPAPTLSGCPEGGEVLNSGVASLLVLGLFFTIVGMAKGRVTRASREQWLRRGAWLLGVSVVVAIMYMGIKGWLVVEVTPNNRVLTGLWTRGEGIAAASLEGRIDRNGILTVVGCRSFQLAWSTGSVILAYGLLMLLYVGLLFSTLGSLFCVSEGVFQSFLSERTPRGPAGRPRNSRITSRQPRSTPPTPEGTQASDQSGGAEPGAH